MIVNDAETARGGDELFNFAYSATSRQPAGKMPAFFMQRAVVDTMLKAAGKKDLAALEADITKDMKPQSFELKDWTVSLELKMHRAQDGIKLKNVIGVLEGAGPLAKEIVVIGAHYDHLGYGGSGGGNRGGQSSEESDLFRSRR